MTHINFDTCMNFTFPEIIMSHVQHKVSENDLTHFKSQLNKMENVFQE